jgi:hypothetical protein
MRIWDVVDLVSPGIQITEIHKNEQRWRGIMSSVAQGVFAVGLVVASSAILSFRQKCEISGSDSNVQVTRIRGAINDALVGEKVGSISPDFERLKLDESLRELTRFRLVSDEPTSEDIGPVTRRFTD